MVDFRRWITALAALAVFAGLASAQNSGSTTAFSCATNVSSTPQIRGEGYTELIGDITLTCTGGTVLGPGASVPQVNVTLFVNAPVTSRLLATVAGGTASEALLLIDEPGSQLIPATGANTNFGAGAPQQVCSTPAGGCGAFVSTVASLGVPTGCTAGTVGCLVGTGALINEATTTFQAGGATPGGLAPNVFQGVVSGNSVTWFGVPVLAPGTTGITRTFRMTNVRIAANILFGGSAAAGTPVTASIAVSNSSTLPITGTTPQVGFVQPGLVASISGTPSSGTGTVLNQCNTNTKASVSLLTFTEGFGTAFKTRLQANANTNSGQTNVVGSGAVSLQNVPGAIYNSESGLTVLVPSSGVTAEAGLADFGTRLKATFNNVPTGVHIFVSVANVLNTVTPAPVPGSAGNGVGGIGSNNPLAYAQLVSDENAVDSIGVNSFFQATSAIPLVAFTDNAPGPGSGGPVQVVEIPLTAGSGRAVWEVVNINPAAIDTLKFAVYATSTQNVSSNSPFPGQGTVTLSFAPTPGPLAPSAFTTAAAAAASGSLPIPRFAVGTTTTNVLDIVVCRTILLYPFVTNQAGFDTGLAIANTSTDAFGTGTQSGGCVLKWYSGATNPADTVVANVASGTVYTNLVSVAAPNFQGYMFAICQFQYAHGFAFISDLGAQKLAEGYLALVIPDPGPGTGGRTASFVAAGAGSGEIAAH
jgi:hypothetical protein